VFFLDKGEGEGLRSKRMGKRNGGLFCRGRCVSNGGKSCLKRIEWEDGSNIS